MPRLPRFLAAGFLLFGAASVLGALLLPGPAAAVVFVAVWYVIAVVNAWLGVVSAGYALREEVAVAGLVFGVPAVVAGVVGSVWAPEVAEGRIWFVWSAGVGLWGAGWLLIGLLAPGRGAASAASSSGSAPSSAASASSAVPPPVIPPASGASSPLGSPSPLPSVPPSASPAGVGAGLAALVFGPLWLIICVVNLVVGVRSAGYTVAEELPVLLANAALPLALALGAWRLLTHPRSPATRRP